MRGLAAAARCGGAFSPVASAAATIFFKYQRGDFIVTRFSSETDPERLRKVRAPP